MQIKWLFLAVAVLGAQAAQAQDRIYRCGNEYTNDASKARQRGCTLVEGGNVTTALAIPMPASSWRPS